MIILRFDGGLGNQMYHYTMYKLLKIRFPDHVIAIDITSYQEGKVHNGYELEKVFPKISLRKAVKKELRGITFYPIQFHPEVISQIYRRAFYFFKRNRLLIPPKNFIRESEWSLFSKNAVLDSEQRYYLDCRWNYSYHYYEDFKTDLLNEFQFCDNVLDKELENLIQSQETVSIHVRAGDYLGSGFNILSADYYRRAVEYIGRNLDKPYYLVISDDEEYAKKILSFFKGNNILYVHTHQNQDAYKDMQIMSKCRHNIIANSTFSYWAAELNQNRKKIVIAPSRYSEKQAEFIVPIDWIKIEI